MEILIRVGLGSEKNLERFRLTDEPCEANRPARTRNNTQSALDLRVRR
jgi:hypothetical protein